MVLTYKSEYTSTKISKEIYKCSVYGMSLKGLKKSILVEERIDGTSYSFDNNGCALIFKKLRSVMGEDKEEEHTA